MTVPDEPTLRRWLALVMLVGAATADADPTQRAMLRERVLPPLSDQTLTPPEARRAACEALLEIMGDQWEPTGDYARYLASIMAPKLDEGPQR
jgi:hypothetical protein